jgi:hypothetical protein
MDHGDFQIFFQILAQGHFGCMQPRLYDGVFPGQNLPSAGKLDMALATNSSRKL